MELLKELYRINAPSGREGKMRRFICQQLKLLGVRYWSDSTGNIYAVKGISDSYPCIVSHMDEVHRGHPKGFTVVCLNDEYLFGLNTNKNQFVGIGADDKNGIWVCLKCLECYDTLKCAFFVGEETGCVGSSRADMTFFEDCRFVLQCDRRGSGDLIHIASDTELCSDKFIVALQGSKFGYHLSRGLMTDVQMLKQQGLKVSCVNLSCGYYNAHTSNEMTRWSELNNCLNFVKHIIGNCTDTYEHSYSPPRTLFDDWYGCGVGRYFAPLNFNKNI